MKTQINMLNFQPMPGLVSSHLQMILSSQLPPGAAPPSKNQLIQLEKGDRLSCEVSTPNQWKKEEQTVVLIHGMGGSHSSSYMIRISRKAYARGNKVVRINLRGCGSGKGLSKLPYHAGTSHDILKVLQVLKEEAGDSEIILIGFSLGGNIALKLAGELGEEAKKLVKMFIAVCPPVDLLQTVQAVQERRNWLYHQYYLKSVRAQARDWIFQEIKTLYQLDDVITGPLWGYRGAREYYQECSSLRFLPNIKQSTHLLFAEDDPFVPLEPVKDVILSDHVNLWSTKKGGHMGFLGRASKARSLYWMDHLLLNWIAGDFLSDIKTPR